MRSQLTEPILKSFVILLAVIELVYCIIQQFTQMIFDVFLSLVKVV